jgi:hypothetical protein
MSLLKQKRSSFQLQVLLPISGGTGLMKKPHGSETDSQPHETTRSNHKPKHRLLQQRPDNSLSNNT